MKTQYDSLYKTEKLFGDMYQELRDFFLSASAGSSWI